MSEHRSQTEVTPTIIGFLGDYRITMPEDLVPLIKRIKGVLEFREYSEQTKDEADRLQWKRTVTEILGDGYVYDGKACSDLCLILIALCKAAGLEAELVKLIQFEGKGSHSLAEIKFNGEWYRIDPTFTEPKPYKGRLTADQIWNKGWQGGWKVWRRGPDLWSMGLHGIEDEQKIVPEQ